MSHRNFDWSGFSRVPHAERTAVAKIIKQVLKVFRCRALFPPEKRDLGGWDIDFGEIICQCDDLEQPRGYGVGLVMKQE